MVKSLYELFPILDDYAESIIKKELGTISTPVDIEKIVDNYGICISKEKMEDYQSGAIAIDEDTCGMVINSNDAEVRQRFTIAHEFGHFVSYKYQGKTGNITEYRDSTSSLGNNIEEVFANKFAAAVLIPKKLFLSLYQYTDEKELANIFNVSDACIRNRVKNLRMTTAYERA